MLGMPTKFLSPSVGLDLTNPVWTRVALLRDLSNSATAYSGAFGITTLAAYAARGSANPILRVCRVFQSAPDDVPVSLLSMRQRALFLAATSCKMFAEV